MTGDADEELTALSPDEVELLRDAAKAERYQSMRDRGRQIGGVPGAIVAGLMVALRDIYEAPKRDNGDVVVDAPSEPHDVDRDGMAFGAADIGGSEDVAIGALAPRPPVTAGRRRRSRRRWFR
jgi:hypothetical protein